MFKIDRIINSISDRSKADLKAQERRKAGLALLASFVEIANTNLNQGFLHGWSVKFESQEATDTVLVRHEVIERGKWRFHPPEVMLEVLPGGRIVLRGKPEYAYAKGREPTVEWEVLPEENYTFDPMCGDVATTLEVEIAEAIAPSEPLDLIEGWEHGR